MPTDPTIADLIADLGDRPYTPPTDTRDALITLARVVAAQADRLDVLEAVVADRAKAPLLTDAETRAEIERMLTGRCRACLDLTHGQTCHCENDE